jgi:hypothetical protein
MSLFVDPNGTGDATQDLLTISWNDPNLNGGAPVTATIHTNIGDVTATQVTYPGGVTTGMATATRLNTLITTTTGNNWGDPILITPMNGGNDPYGFGGDVTGNGVTYVDTSVTPNVIHVVYDTSQCLGAGLALFDTSNNPIATPNAVILYHELSHAFHNALNQIPFPQAVCPGNTSDEPAAEVDENVLRSQLGLCLRDPCNHNGNCGHGATCGGSATPNGPPASSGGSGGSGGCCFVVSAATRSTESAEMHRLRHLRGRVVAKSVFGARLIELIYREYNQFSPAIADRLQEDAMARMAALWIAVRPLLAWYRLAGALALKDAGPEAVNEALRELSSALPGEFGKASIAAVLEAFRTGAPLPEDTPSMLLPFESRLRQAARLRYASWAILDPLARVWEGVARSSDAVAEVAQWLAAAPLETLTPPADPARLDAQLGNLAVFYDFQPEARRQIGARLAAAWPQALEALQRHGFL